MDEISRLLKEGIQAVKAGRSEHARALLMQVIEADEENERAWLWLSGAVETDEDRRLCLENVLTINPHNELAQKGLARLKPLKAKVQDEVEDIALPTSLSGAGDQVDMAEPISEISLLPSLEARAAHSGLAKPKQEASWWLEKPIVEPTLTEPEKNYYDVWASQEDICAYCAGSAERSQSRCRHCQRPLLVKALLHPVPSPYHRILFAWMLISLAIYAGLVGYAFFRATLVLPEMERADLLTQAISAVVPLVVITVGVQQRQVWGYWLLIVQAVIEAGLLLWLAFNLLSVLSALGSRGFLNAVQAEPSLLFLLIVVILFLLILLFNVFTIYMAREDFRRIPMRRLATVNDRLKDPVLLDKVAQRLAKEEQWASAVLHWQRAVEQDNGHAPYLLYLGQAYTELGFYERSMDILKSAMEVVRNRDVREALEQAIVRNKRLSETADATKTMSQPDQKGQNRAVRR